MTPEQQQAERQLREAAQKEAMKKKK